VARHWQHLALSAFEVEFSFSSRPRASGHFSAFVTFSFPSICPERKRAPVRFLRLPPLAEGFGGKATKRRAAGFAGAAHKYVARRKQYNRTQQIERDQSNTHNNYIKMVKQVTSKDEFNTELANAGSKLV
jgi:hypothetical protein